ncbi:Heptahelical transmembrane protein 2 [Spatholobus suberectus]|nr:Heptahelical transmembrane protein 2 [Spatholobus suberectus]
MGIVTTRDVSHRVATIKRCHSRSSRSCTPLGPPHVVVALGYELLMAILYATGAVFYVTRIPEQWKPGAFDIAGHSHQIFHVFVALGALAHTLAILLVMEFRRGSPNCAF